MTIKVRISSAHQYAANGSEVVEVAGNTIAESLRDLIKTYPNLEKFMYNDPRTLSNYLLVFLNGDNVPHNELNKPVKDGDEISLVMLIDGG